MLLNTKQAGNKLGIKDSRVRKLILAGRLPAMKVGRDWIIKEQDLDFVKDRKPGKPKKISQARLPEPKSGDPDRLPVSKPSGRR